MGFVDIMAFQTKVLGTKEENLKQMAECMEKADLKNVDMVTFPEMFLCPYETNVFRFSLKEKGKGPGNGSAVWLKPIGCIYRPGQCRNWGKMDGFIIRPMYLTGRAGKLQNTEKFTCLMSISRVDSILKSRKPCLREMKRPCLIRNLVKWACVFVMISGSRNWPGRWSIGERSFS